MGLTNLQHSLKFTQQLGSVNSGQRDRALGQQRLCLWNNPASSCHSSNQAKAWSQQQFSFFCNKQRPLLLIFESTNSVDRLRPAFIQQHLLRSNPLKAFREKQWGHDKPRWARQTASKAGGQTEVRLPEKPANSLQRKGPGNFLLEVAVWGTTELLRLLGIGGRASNNSSSALTALSEDPPLSTLDEVLEALRKDYTEQAYFVTGNITNVLYDRNCYFADPTVNFTGREKWKQNLKLLVPFLENPTITLLSMEPDDEQGKLVVKTRWILRTYLKLPWRPYIDVLGGTTHTFNERLQIVEHVERWSISSLDAIKQIFVPSQRAWQ